MKTQISTYLILFCGVFSLSTSAIFVRTAAAPSAIIAFYRLFFAALVLLPFLLLHKRNRQELFLLTGKQWGLGLLSGLFLAVHYVLWFESLRYTSVASSTVIVTLQPLFSIAGGYLLFKERLDKKALIGCFIAISGSIVIGWGDLRLSPQALFGDLLAFLAAGVIAAYFFIGQHVRKNLSVIPYSLLGYGSSALFLAIYAFSWEVSFINYPATTWASFIGLALIATIGGQMIFNWLLKWLSTTVISMSILGETIGTCILAYFLLHEGISLQQGIGIVMILAGLLLFMLKSQKTSDLSPDQTSETETVNTVCS